MRKVAFDDPLVTAFDRRYGTVQFRAASEDDKRDPHPAELDHGRLFEDGIIASKPELLRNFQSKNGAIRVTRTDRVDTNTLNLQRSGRAVASGVSAGMNVLSAGALTYYGSKMIGSALKGEDTSDLYSKIGHSFSFSIIPGIATGLALENSYFGIGSALMGVFSNIQNKPWGLGLFSIFDGIHSIGYSQVRYKTEKNALSTQKSIFSNPALFPFRYFQPVEQSIKHCANMFKGGFKQMFDDEPYSTCSAAGGGMVAGGAALVAMSPFAKLVPEWVRNAPYAIYGALSSMFLVSLFRDGLIINWRAKKFQGNPAGQKEIKYLEGFFKKIAAPILGSNNLLLFLKGIGLETTGGMLYDTASGLRSIGAAMAMLGYGAQSIFNWVKPMNLGPKVKEITNIVVNPRLAKEALFEKVRSKRPDPTWRVYEQGGPANSMRKVLYDVLENDGPAGVQDKRFGEVYTAIRKTDVFKRLETFSQTGLINPSNEFTLDRANLERKSHCEEVGAVGMILYNTLLSEAAPKAREELIAQHSDKIKELYPRGVDDASTADLLKAVSTVDNLELGPAADYYKYLLDHELAYKIATLVHDAGHCARSHVAEKAIHGLDNDEHTAKLVEGTATDKSLHEEIVRQAQVLGYDPGSLIKQILEIYKRTSPLFKLMKDADRIQYQRLGDFLCINDRRIEFPAIDKEGIEDYARSMIFYKDNGKYKRAFTEEGALQLLMREYNRLVFDLRFNNNELAQAESEAIYSIGLDAYRKAHPSVTVSDFTMMTEQQMDRCVEEGLDLLSVGDHINTVTLELTFGGESYSGYYKHDPKNQIVVIDDYGNKHEVMEYIETIIKHKDHKLYNYLRPKMTALETDTMKKVNLIFGNNDDTLRKVEPNLKPIELQRSRQNLQQVFDFISVT